QEFFTAKHGVQAYRIVESLGATEGAPASGAADLIVDITSTGETLKANGLRILVDGLILKSEACLVARAGLKKKEATEAASLLSLLDAV
ncbi:MAG: ATP phosphoribosyltransferase, partial [Notoacmeibacter sp.]